MASRFTVVPVPDMERDLRSARRVVDQNFQAIKDLLNRAIADGSILTDASKMLVGDVTGTIGATGNTVVERLQTGLLAARPVAPAVGRIWAATDTERLYIYL